MTTPNGPGLDIDALRGLRRARGNEDQIVRRIVQHLDDHDGYVAFSGGKDSACVLHLARQADPNVPVAFFDSGLEYPDTYRYLDQLQGRWRLNLHVIAAQPSTLEILAAAGKWSHDQPTRVTTDLRTATITAPASTAHHAHGPGELWGVRADESQGRRALYGRALRAETEHRCGSCCSTAEQRRARHGGVIRRLNGTTAYGPIWDWATEEVWAYLSRHQVPVNPVYGKLRRLGAPPRALRLSQMLDGDHLETGRATWLRRGWPDLFEDLCCVLPRLREYV